MWLLRSTDFFVGTAVSSFSELASFGRDVLAVLTRAPTPEYRRVERWLEMTKLSQVLSFLAQREFGEEVPYTMLHARYRQRLNNLLRRRRSRKG